MHKPLAASFSLLAGLSALVLTAPGCKPIVVQAEMAGPILVTGHLSAEASLASVEYTGTFISEELYDTIVVEETSTTFLKALVGEPDRTAELGGGETLWIYRYAPTEQSASLVSLFGAEGTIDPRFVTNVFRVRGGTIVSKLRG